MPTATETHSASQLARNLAGKFLTFSLADESCGIAVLKVREIIQLVAITSVPQMPAHVKGVVNLRGRIIPVIDLRVKFGMPACAQTDRTCIIVAQVSGPAGTKSALGLLVDSVEEVLNIAAAEIEDTPDFGGAATVSYLLGMAKIKGRVVSLLDIDRVVGSDDGVCGPRLLAATEGRPASA